MTDTRPTLYDGLNADKIRNALSTETDLDVLRTFAADSRKRVSEKAVARLAKLTDSAAPVSDGAAGWGESKAQLDAILHPTETPPPLDDPPTEAALDKVVEVAKEVGLAEPAERLVEAVKEERRRSKTNRRKNLGASDTVPPVETKPEAPAPKVKAKRKAKAKQPKHDGVIADKDFGTTKTCPKCGETKPIDTGFGWRKLPRAKAKGGGTYLGPQPHCTVCRREASKRSRVAPVRELTKQAVADRIEKRQAREQKRAEARVAKAQAPTPPTPEAG